jgi:hypothetical protein
MKEFLTQLKVLVVELASAVLFVALVYCVTVHELHLLFRK